MTQESLKEAIAAAQQRLESLLHRASEDNSTEIVQEAIAELSDSLEELHVVAEELEAQNEELTATREVIETERQLYQDLFNLTSDGYLVTDAAGIIQAANPAAEQLLNTKLSHLVGKPLAVFVHPQQHQKFRHILTQLPQEQKIRREELQIFHQERKIDFSAELTGAAMRDTQGKFVSLCFLVKDISDRQQAQEKLAQSENLVRTIIESQPECVKLLAQNGILLSINPAGLAIIEADSLAQVQSRSFYHFVISDYRPAFQALTEQVFQGESGKLEFEIVGLKGTRRWLETHAVPFRNTNGKIVSCLSVTRDISDRKRLEIELQVSETKLSNILNSAIAAIISFRIFPDLHLEDIYWSAGCELVFGYTAEEFMADKNLWVSRVFPEDWETVVLPVFEDIFFERNNVAEYRFLDKDGHLRWIGETYSSMPDPAENCWIVTTVATDISDRKRAEIALSEKEQQLRLITDGLPAYIAYLDASQRYQFVNKMYELRFGMPREQICGRYIREILGEDTYKFVQGYIEQVLAGNPISYEAAKPHSQLGTEYLYATLIPDIGQDNQVKGWYNLILDITERKRLELALQKSEAQLSDIIHNAIASIVSIRAFADGTWEYDYYSPSCEAIFGFTAEEMMAGVWWSRIPPEDQQSIIIPAQQYVFAEQSTRMEYRFLHKDGTLRWICSDISSRWDEANRCFRVIAVDIDISDRKIAEDKLAKISTALSYAVEGISYLDTQGRYVTVNKAYANMVGYSSEEMVGMLWTPTVHSEDLETMQAAYQRMLSNGKVEVEARGIRKDGSIFYKQLVMVAAYDDRQQLTGHYCFMKDISDRKQTEFLLQRQFQQQQLLNRVMQAIRNSLDLNAIFKTATTEFIQLFSSSEGSYILQYLAEPKVWQIVAEYHQDPQAPNTIGFEIPDENNPVADRLKQLEIVQFSDTNTIEDEVNRKVGNLFPGSWLIIPLTAGGTICGVGESVWGCLSLIDSQPNTIWHNDQIELARAVADQLGIAIQQANLYQQLQQELIERQQAQIQLQTQAQQKELLNRVIQGIRNSLDLNLIFQTATAEFAQLLSAEESYITQYFPEQQIWRVVGGYRQNPEIIDKIGSEIPHTENFITGKLKQREIVQISDTNILEDEVHKQIAQIYPGAWLIVPLIVGNSLWGCFSLIDSQNNTIWNDEQVELARAVADQVGIAIQQANLYQQLQQELIERQQAQIQLQRQAQQKEVLNRVIQKIRNSLDLNAIFQTAMAEFAQLFAAAESYITQYVPEQQIWRVVAGSQPNSEMNNHIGLEIPDSENFVAAKLKNLEIVQISDADILQDRVNQELAQIFPGSWLIVPLICSESVWGSLNLLDSPSNSIWDDYRVELARAVADQLAIAIQQANLYQQLQQELSDRKQAQIELQTAKEAAETANVAKSTFLANMSHELRTPLNAILGFTQMMARDASLSSQQQEQVKIINNAGDHLLALINDILEMSKIEAGRTSFNLTSFDLIYLLLTLEELFKFKAESKGLQLKFELDTALPQYIQTDEGKLRQVIINIIGNAIKFTDQGQVILRAKLTHQSEILPTTNYQLTFEIEDTGPGIDCQEIDRIFDPFTQSESGKKFIQGTGLGLAISRKFVQMMGGDIRVSSEQNQGSLFTFDIQVTSSPAVEKNPAETPRQIVGLAPNQPEYRILVVDDHPESRLLLVTLLSSIGFRVNQTYNGQEAVSIWSTWKPDLICMDIRMPVMDGIQATQQIRAKEKEIANASNLINRQLPIPAYPTTIVALTANAFDADKNSALAAGCDDYISKPLQPDMVLQKIGKYLNIAYIYGSENQATDKANQNYSSNIAITQIKALLDKMPVDWLSTLHKNAYIGDESIILELLKQIPPEDATLAKALIDLTNNFEFDKIIELTQTSGS